MVQDQKEKENESEILRLGENLSCAMADHYFVRNELNEAECRKCPIGYPLGIGSEVKNGHIYIHGEFVI